MVASPVDTRLDITTNEQIRALDQPLPCPLCLGNNSRDLAKDRIKNNTRLNAKVHEFFVSFETIIVRDIEGIHKYLIRKHNID